MTTTTIPSLYRDPEVRRLAREVVRLQRDVRTFGRASQAAYRSSDGTGNDEDLGDFDDDGNPLDEQGHPETWVPPTPTPPDINPYMDAVEFVWDGTFEAGAWDASIANILIHVLLEVTATPEEATVVGTFGQEGGVFPYNITLDEGVKFVSLQAVSRTGVAGAWSFPIPIIPFIGVDPEELAALQTDLANLNTVILPSLQTDLAGLEGLFPVTATSIADGAITTPKIVVGSLLGDRIVANSLSGNTIIANTIYGDRIVINTLSGDRIIANTISGDRVIANTLHGNRIIAGTIYANQILASTFYGYEFTGSKFTGGIFQTAASGARILIENVNTNRIWFYTGTDDGPGIISTGSTSSTETMHLTGPRNGATVNPPQIVMTDYGSNTTAISLNASLTTATAMEVHTLTSVAAPSSPSAANVFINTNGLIARSTSSLRYKDVVGATGLNPATVLALDDIAFTMKGDDSGQVWFGFAAEQVHNLGMSEFVDYDSRGRPDGVGYGTLAAVGHHVVLRDHEQRIRDLERILANPA